MRPGISVLELVQVASVRRTNPLSPKELQRWLVELGFAVRRPDGRLEATPRLEPGTLSRRSTRTIEGDAMSGRCRRPLAKECRREHRFSRSFQDRKRNQSGGRVAR
jgi:hypothetical protein